MECHWHSDTMSFPHPQELRIRTQAKAATRITQPYSPSGITKWQPLRKNIYPLSPVHAFPSAWSGSVRKPKDTSGLHDATGFWNGKSNPIKPAHGLQAGNLPEKRHFYGVWKRNTSRHAENDFPLSAEWFSILLRLNCIYAGDMQNNNAYTV